MDKTHVPYPGCYCADCVEGTPSTQAREARIARYLSNEKAARESLATYPESTRQRLEAWQSEQSEWFSDTVLEIVAEFITIDDAIRQSAERGEVVAVARKLETAFVVQMEAQADDTTPSSIHREQGRVWLEGWFDLNTALSNALAAVRGKQ